MGFIEFRVLLRLVLKQHHYLSKVEHHLEHHLKEIERTLETVTSNQEQLNADVSALGDAIAAVEQEVSDLKNQPPEALDFTGLDAAVARLQGDAPAPAPAPVTPPDQPTQ